MTDLVATHTLTDVTVRRMTVVKAGANGKRWFLRKSAEDEGGVAIGEPAPLLKGADDWSTAYVVVAEPGWVEQGGQGAAGVADVWKSADEIEKAAHRFMAAGGDVNRLVHGSDTDPNLKIVENAVALADFEVDGTTIRKGSWYVGVQLDAAAREMVEKGEITGVSIEGTGLRTEIGKDAPSDRSVMVALYPPAEVANALAIDGGEHPADIHLTLAYLGDIQDDRIHLVVDAVERAVEGLDTDGLSGTVSGAGTFAAGSGPGASKPVHYASVDAPALPALRDAITTYLRSVGTPAREDHGFTPHMTLKYGRGATPRVESTPVSFPEVHIVRGDRDVATVPLRPLRVPEAALSKVRVPIPNDPTKTNAVERAGGFPPYIRHVIEEMIGNGLPTSKAVQRGLGIVKNWKDGHDGKGNKVSEKTQGKAAAAWADYTTRLKAQSAVKKESIVTRIIDTLKKALAGGEDSLDAEEKALLAAIAKEADPGSAAPAGTVEKTEPAGATKETDMDETKLAEALAKALEPTTKAIEATNERIEKLEKAATPEPEKPTVEGLAKEFDEFSGGVVAKLDQIGKGLEALGAGSSTQAAEPVRKSYDGSGQSEWAKSGAAGVLFGD